MQRRKSCVINIIFGLAILITLCWLTLSERKDWRRQNLPFFLDGGPYPGPRDNGLDVRVSRDNRVTLRFYALTARSNQERLKKAFLETFPDLKNAQRIPPDPNYRDPGLEPKTLEIGADWNAPALLSGKKRHTAVDLSPLLKAMQRAGFEGLFVSLHLPKGENGYLTGAASRSDSDYFPTYEKLITTKSGTNSLLDFGFDYRAWWQNGILGSLL